LKHQWSVFNQWRDVGHRQLDWQVAAPVLVPPSSPALLATRINPQDWFAAYGVISLERDLRQLIRV
jgi:hypothetical protein